MIAGSRALLAGAVLALILPACARTTSTTAQRPAAPAAAAAGAGAAAEAEKPAVPKALIATSPDGTRIAYEVTGSGPALLLVHGGGQTRRSWNQLGYVDRLAKKFTVITMDGRGFGDSDRPTAPGSYALDKVLADILAVADAARAPRFHVWGFGQGATLARYLAARSDRITAAVLVGTSFGPPVTGIFKDAIVAMRDKWRPLIDAHAAGTLDMKTLSQSDRSAWDGGVAVSVLSLGALLEYPPLEPAEITAPTLWVVGTEDSVMQNVKEYEEKLAGTRVSLRTLSSVNYSDSFVKMNDVVAAIEPFLLKASATTTTR